MAWAPDTPLDLIECETPLESFTLREVGGKGWNLFRLKSFGFPVPDWFVLSSRVFDRALEARRGEIEALVAGADFASRESLEATADRISRLLEAWEFPPTLTRDLEAGLERLAGGDARLSVRSSVVGEDSAAHSFAGLMDSVLNVPREGVPGAIRQVWRSAFSARALLYRRHRGLAVADVSAAVILQRMVDSAASGVLFTREPRTGERTCVISAALGLGEGVVANRVETDTYVVGWDSERVAKTVVAKESRVVAAREAARDAESGGERAGRQPGAARGGVRLDRVPAKLRDRAVLDDRRILELRDAGVKAERCFGLPQDIEWAYGEDGRLALLQSRPIVGLGSASSATGAAGPLAPESDPSRSAAASADTAAGAAARPDLAPDSGAAPPPPGEVRVWDNSNIVESYPGLTLPLTFSFVRSAYEHTFRNAALGFLLDRRAIAPALSIFPSMIGLIEGRVYYNLLNWYSMLSYLPGFDRHRQAWDEMIGVAHRVEFPSRRLSPLNRAGAALLAVWRLLGNRRTSRVFFRHFDALWDDFRRRDFSRAGEPELTACYDELALRTRKVWHLTLYNDFCAMTCYEWLRRLCAHPRLAAEPNLHNDLLCGETGVESVAPLRSLLELAARVRSDPRAAALLEDPDDARAWRSFHSDPALAELSAALDAHVEAFGDRGLEELKLETPRLGERPELAIRLIRGYARGAVSVEDMERREQAVRRRAEDFAGAHLGHSLRRAIFAWVLAHARFAIASRENMRLARTRLFGIVKRLFRRMAELFVARGLIDSEGDLHYLTVEEVFGTAQGTAATRDLRALVATRRAEYAEYARRSPPERFVSTGIPSLGGAEPPRPAPAAGRTLQGIGCSSGRAEAPARVVLDPSRPVPAGDHILVARSTDPGWLFLMISSLGIVVEKGSVLSHTAIIGRELGIPTIVGVQGATARITDGDRIAIDGGTGEIRWV